MPIDQPGVVFRYSFLALLCLSSIILSYSENYLFPQILGIPIILFTYTYVDKQQKLSISPTTAAFFGLIAISLGFVEFLYGGIEARILSAAHLVSYLLWITLFQNKEPRQYWWMTALTVMQVSVASVLTSDGFFGLGILLYLFLVIWTLAFFSVYRAALRIRSATNNIQSKLQAATDVALKFSTERKLHLKTTRSTTRGSIHLNPGEPWISWQFFGGVTAITLLSLIVAGMFFILTPRLWLGRIHFPSDSNETSATSLSGFTESVRLGEMGNILENPAVVFTTKIMNLQEGKSISPEEFCTEYGMDAILYRGSVMINYRDSKWNGTNESFDSNRRYFNRDEELYSCEYQQEQTTGSFLFSLGRLGDINEISESIGAITVDSLSGVIKSSYPGKLKYRHSINSPIVKDGHICNPVSERTLLNYFNCNYLGVCSYFPDFKLNGILNFTKKLIEAEENRLQREMSDLEVAFYLESYLQNSSDFTYSLNQTINDPTIDPVEDFLLNRKAGHCEYFSSALALMLRSQKIPTRLISGFKGGDYNNDLQQSVIKQLHAHAWLEFYDYENKQWITMDPTPAAARETQLAQIQSSVNSAESLSALALNFWNNYVVNVSLEQQQRLLYAPLYEMLRSTWDSMQGVRQLIGSNWEIVVDIFSDPKQLFSLRGFILVSILGTLAVIVWFLINKIIPTIKRKLLLNNLDYHSDLKVIFYERYLQLLKKLRLVREDQQTPLEFSHIASTKLQQNPELKEYLPFLEEITLAYYQIRFGHYELSEKEQENCISKVDKLDELITHLRAN